MYRARQAQHKEDERFLYDAVQMRPRPPLLLRHVRLADPPLVWYVHVQLEHRAKGQRSVQRGKLVHEDVRAHDILGHVHPKRPQGRILRALFDEEDHPIGHVEDFESGSERAHECVKFGGREAIVCIKDRKRTQRDAEDTQRREGTRGLDNRLHLIASSYLAIQVRAAWRAG